MLIMRVKASLRAIRLNGHRPITLIKQCFIKIDRPI